MRHRWTAFFMAVLVLGLPWVGMATTIYDVQHNETNQGSGDDCYSSPLYNQTVTISGVVTHVGLSTGYPDFWMQDPNDPLWSGVFVFDSTVEPTLGDSLTITAAVDEYYGLTEMKNISSFSIHASDVAVPAPADIETADLAGGCNAGSETYEGMLVRLRNVTVTQAPNSYGEWYVDDGSGECQIDDYVYRVTPDPTVGQSFAAITGVVHYSYGDYELLPRDADDIVEEITGPPSISGTAHDPVSPLYTEAVVVTSRVTDDASVELVTLFYSTNEGSSWESVSMADDGVAPDETAFDDVYTGQIGAQPEGTVVDYYVHAVDDEELEATDPENAPTSTYSYTVRGGIPGDGSGTASIEPDTVDISETVSITIAVQGDAAVQDNLTTVIAVVADGWSWSQSVSDVSLSGSGFSGASAEVAGDTIVIAGAAINDRDEGQLIIADLTSPSSMTTSTFLVKTAVDGGIAAEIESSPQVVVGVEEAEYTPIANIQDSSSYYEGKTVTIRAVVTIGAGVLDDLYTRAYVQDESGRGINLFNFDILPEITRGNLVEVTGTIEDYLASGAIDATTEITDISALTVLDTNQPLPDPVILSTGGAQSGEWDGTWIQVTGVLQEAPYYAGGGYNVNIDDGSGRYTIRIWDTTEIDLSEFTEGDTITAIGAGSVYSTSYQMLTGYQEDIFEGQPVAEGIGFASISPSTVKATATGITETITIWSDQDNTLVEISIDIPNSWTWAQPDASGVQLSGEGFPEGTTVEISGDRTIMISGAEVTAEAQGVVAILDLGVPEIGEISTFRVKTAALGKPLKEIQNSPQVKVEGLDKAVLSVEPRVFVPNRQAYSDDEGFDIEFNVPTNSRVVMRLFDIEGRLVRTLIDEEQYAGPGKYVWNGRDELREVVPVGVYICHLEATDREKGTTTTDQVPIVVGMALD